LEVIFVLRELDVCFLKELCSSQLVNAVRWDDNVEIKSYGGRRGRREVYG
jgi:hypothetical protein